MAFFEIEVFKISKKESIIEEIIKYYLESNDFNGLPTYQMKNFDYHIICGLIDEGLIEVISDNEVPNPHIKAYPLSIPLELQKQNLLSKTRHSVLYPTKESLKNIEIDSNQPYTPQMQKGEVQLKIIYFNIELLERYANNPIFTIMDNGYRGSICISDEHFKKDETQDNEYIKDYGIAYIADNLNERAFGVFLCDLAKLSSSKQMLWKGFEIADQSNCRINSGFVKNLIYGEWVEEVWIFHTLIEEMIVINKQCECMGIPKLFNKTYGTHYSKMPEGYRNILLPTLKNYHDFVLVLEKMVVHNLSYKTFQKRAVNVKKIDRCDEDGKEKGSLSMLEEWLIINNRTGQGISEIIIKPLKYIRKIRQTPAHKLISNEYDISLYDKQHELISNTYQSIRAIRLLFSTHPFAKQVEVPDYLIFGKNIVHY